MTTALIVTDPQVSPLQWRKIGDWPYEVSNTGLVRSMTKVGRGRWGERIFNGKVLKQNVLASGYAQVALQDAGLRKYVKVHRLVLLAFVGPPPVGTEARHLNGVRLDNRVDNLCWGTKIENNNDRVKHGTHPQLNKTHCPSGHPYNEENTYWYKGGRHCRECRSRQFLEFKQREREDNI